MDSLHNGMRPLHDGAFLPSFFLFPYVSVRVRACPCVSVRVRTCPCVGVPVRTCPPPVSFSCSVYDIVDFIFGKMRIVLESSSAVIFEQSSFHSQEGSLGQKSAGGIAFESGALNPVRLVVDIVRISVHDAQTGTRRQGYLVIRSKRHTMVENSQEYRLKYWDTRSSVRSFARTAHSWESELLDGYFICVFLHFRS